MSRFLPFCLCAVLFTAAQVSARTEYRLGGVDGTPWLDALNQSEAGAYLIFDADNQQVGSAPIAIAPQESGADTLIDVAIEQKGIRGADDGFLLLFSATAFPGAEFHLEWRREEMAGNVYLWPDGDHEAWLCPALLKYFDEPPQDLFVQVKQAR